jgi:hypothetical protein
MTSPPPLSLEARVAHLEAEVAALRHCLSTGRGAAAAAPLPPPPAVALDEWLTQFAFGQRDYELLNEYKTYYECLKRVLLRNAHEIHPHPFYINKRHQLYVYVHDDWTRLDTGTMMYILDEISKKFHAYYLDYIQPYRPTQSREIENKYIQLCKINENKYRNYRSLRDAIHGLVLLYSEENV